MNQQVAKPFIVDQQFKLSLLEVLGGNTNDNSINN